MAFSSRAGAKMCYLCVGRCFHAGPLWSRPQISVGGSEVKDLFAKCEEFLRSAGGLSVRDAQLAAELFTDVSPIRNAGPWIERNGDRILQFSSNDYLGLAMHPEVRRRAEQIVHEFGICSPMGSRAMTGTTAEHVALEEQLAAFKRCEAALVFSTGSATMMGVLAALGSVKDVWLLDQFAHASLVCGARISGATIAAFHHNDMEHLESLLRRYANRSAVGIVVDGVYSMQGTLAPLPKLVELKHKYGARLIVDDAHGTGVMGPQGRGTAAHFGVESEVDLQLGTFSKAIGTMGGFAAGDRRVIDYLRFTAPTLLFTKSLPLAVVAATSQALELLEAADGARERLWANARLLQGGLRSRRFEIGRTESPITPVEFDGAEALPVARTLRQEHGIWVAPVLFPAVEQGKSVVRLTPTALHRPEDIDRLLDALSMAVCSDLFSFAS